MSAHTYTLHIEIGARDDRHAIEISSDILNTIENWAAHHEESGPVMVLTSRGNYVASVYVTDTDDWAEHVPVEDSCFFCGEGGTNRIRSGNGHRACESCNPHYYPNHSEEL